tara:strand:- start:12225 stop:13208 length:984 start_codon:yes stop_codon:yes gene_type:complete
MIITRSPLRISLGGGGTDLPSYYQQKNGFLIAGSIDKYVYLTLHKTFVKELILNYSNPERVNKLEDIEHPIFREALRLLNINPSNIEISCMADIPAGTGLGSSGSFSTALLKILHFYKNNLVHPEQLAEQACKIEIDILKEPVGKQDQYIAAYGGLTCFEFQKDGKVIARQLKIDDDTRHELQDNLLLFFTGYSRSAGSILKEQDQKTKKSNVEMIKNLDHVKEMGFASMNALENGDLIQFGQIMHEHWIRKKERAKNMTNPKIDNWYNLAMDNGAIGGKLIGAGGGGFLMFYSQNKRKLRKTLVDAGMQEVRFNFVFEGTKILTIN